MKLAEYTKQPGKIFATTHSLIGSITEMAPILSLIYSKIKPGNLTNPGGVIPNCSSGSDLSTLVSKCYMLSLVTKSLAIVLV